MNLLWSQQLKELHRVEGPPGPQVGLRIEGRPGTNTAGVWSPLQLSAPRDGFGKFMVALRTLVGLHFL